MGGLCSVTYFEGNKPDYVPQVNAKPTFPPDLGFPEPRKERVSQMTEQEMEALLIPKKERDYCAHKLKEVMMCKRHYSPFHYLCRPEVHAYKECQLEDLILRNKEYEREKRLRIRELKSQGITVS